MQITAFKAINKQKSSGAIAKHYKNMHGTMPQDLLKRFEVLIKKCRNKFDCLAYEMLFLIWALKPNVKVQSDSIRAKVFLYFLYSVRTLMLILRAKIALNQFSNDCRV